MSSILPVSLDFHMILQSEDMESPTGIHKGTTLRRQVQPLEALLQDKVYDRSILLRQHEGVLPVLAKIRRDALEEIRTVGLCQPISAKVAQQRSGLSYAPTAFCTSGHVMRWYSESGVPMIRSSFSERPERKSGHSAGHSSRGTFTSQNGRGSDGASGGMTTGA